MHGQQADREHVHGPGRPRASVRLFTRPARLHSTSPLSVFLQMLDTRHTAKDYGLLLGTATQITLCTIGQAGFCRDCLRYSQ